MKKQKSLKLALISLLSDPNVIIEEYNLEKEFLDTSDLSNHDSYTLTGRHFIKLTIFKNDNTTDKTVPGTTTGTKNSD